MPVGKVLLVDPGDSHVRALERHLDQAGFDVVDGFQDGDLVSCVRSESPDVVLVQDLVGSGHPETRVSSALTISRQLRDDTSTRDVPIVVLSPGKSGCTLADCRAAGVDQCFKKPVALERVVERLELLISQAGTSPRFPTGFRFEYKGLVIDTDRYQVTYRGVDLALTVREFQVLVALAKARGAVLDRADLLQRIGLVGRVKERNIDTHVDAVRRKLGAGGRLIATVFGVGYKLRL